MLMAEKDNVAGQVQRTILLSVSSQIFFSFLFFLSFFSFFFFFKSTKCLIHLEVLKRPRASTLWNNIAALLWRQTASITLYTNLHLCPGNLRWQCRMPVVLVEPCQLCWGKWHHVRTSIMVLFLEKSAWLRSCEVNRNRSAFRAKMIKGNSNQVKSASHFNEDASEMLSGWPTPKFRWQSLVPGHTL